MVTLCDLLLRYSTSASCAFISYASREPSLSSLILAGPGQLKVDYAISREMTNPFDGGKMYVQHVMQQNAQELFQRLDNGASCYFCGLKGMMPPILETLEQVAAKQGLDWDAKLKEWKANHQWHVEVY